MKNTVFYFLIFLLSISTVNAQDLDDVFDDGLTTSDNSIFFGANYFLEGAFTLGYERNIGGRKSYSVWAGVIFDEGIPTHAYLGDEMINYYSNQDNLNSGFLVGTNLKGYLYDNAGLFIGYEAGFEMRRGNTFGRNAYKLVFIVGYNWQFPKNNMGISISSGVGVQFFNRYRIVKLEYVYPTDSYAGFGALIPFKLDLIKYF